MQVIRIDKYSPEVCCVIGNHYSLKGQHEKAVLYFQRALCVCPVYVSAYTLMGHEYIELHNISMAIACYRQAVDINAQGESGGYDVGCRVYGVRRNLSATRRSSFIEQQNAAGC